MRILISALLWVSVCWNVVAQDTPTLPAGKVFVDGLSRAVSFRLDPSGRMYIADPGRHVIDIRDPDGSQVYVLGGPGAGEAQFDDPLDVDPTTGLLLVVADAGNSRIARFGARYEFSESIPLYGSARESLDLSVAIVDPRGWGEDRTPGRPISVALSESNETFAIDEVRGVVARWDISRRLVDLIGDESVEVPLSRPTDLEIVGDQLHVADADLESVVVYDLFGGYVTEYGGGQLVNLEGLGSWNGKLWVLHDGQVSVYSAGGGRELTVRLPQATRGAVDLAVFSDVVYVLTRRRVVSWPFEAFMEAGRADAD